MSVIGLSTKKFKPVADELSYAVYYKNKESEEWRVNHGLSRYRAKVESLALANDYAIVEVKKEHYNAN
jgi:hypothetical protein